MMKSNSQFINSFLIIGGGAILVYEISGDEKNVYLLILGLVLLMFGLYRATNHWAITKDDHKQEDGENKSDKNK